ncbi:hypothetical protein N3K66_006494 [Trichothecium roseum]|uniref:Uncharacterized protein n=1 Tax=Trichothecium roseum TaxID=47278 RepID=A0ACC0UVY1_9HYPO|nr:hypothetical protein N3K66_006494 [Trichothecium roseum]
MGKTYEYEEFSSYRRPRRGGGDDSDSDFDSTARNHHNYPPSSRNGGRGHSRSRSRSTHHRDRGDRHDDSDDDFVREEMHLAPPSRADGPRSRSVPPSSAEGMQLTRAAPPPAPSSHHSGGKDKERDQMALAYPYDSDPDERALARDELRRRDRSESPITRARSTVQDNLTNSTAGIGASLLGAVVGGFAAREASSAARRHRDKSARGNGGRRYSDKEQENDNRIAMLSTLVGAVAGGLGANVLTNKFEDGRAKSKDTQREWERRHGREEDLPHYDDGAGRKGDRRDTYNDRDYSRDRRSGAYRRYDEEDDEYDFVYDKRGGGPRREVSESGYR